MPDDEFRDQLQRRIGAIRALREKIQSDADEIQAELEQVQQRLTSAERMYEMEFGEPVSGEVVVDLLPRPQAPKPGPLTGLSWAEAITRILSKEDGPLHVRSIWERLQAGGFTTGSQDPLRSIVAILVRSEDFMKVRPNTYGLIGVATSRPDEGALPLE